VSVAVRDTSSSLGDEPLEGRKYFLRDCERLNTSKASFRFTTGDGGIWIASPIMPLWLGLICCFADMLCVSRDLLACVNPNRSVSHVYDQGNRIA